MRIWSGAALFISVSVLAITAARAEDVVLDTISVTATKTEEPAIDVMGGASIVNRAQIERFQPSRLSDTFRDVPGVWVQENANDPAQSINIRGLQDFGRVNVMIDGARQNFQVSGHNANGQFYLDPEFVSQIDVTRGPIANIYGSGAIGGVVLFKTRGIDDLLKPDEKVGISQKGMLGTNGAGFLSSTMAGARLGPNVDVFGQFLTRETYNYRDGRGTVIGDTGSEIVGGLFKVNVRPADGHEVSLTAFRQKFEFDNNGSSNQGARFADALNTETYTLGYRFTRPDTPLLDFNVKLYDNKYHMSQRYLADSPSGIYSTLGAKPGLSRIVYDLESKGFDVFNTSRFDTGAFSHAVTYGADGVWDNVKNFDTAGGYGSTFTPSGERQLNGAYIQDEIRYGGWLRVLGGARYDYYKLSSPVNTSDGSRVSPKITLGITPITGIEFYGTYAEAYRAPTITETLIQGVHPFPAFRLLPNPNLRPETAHNLEAGVNIKYNNVFTAGDSFRAKATIFRNVIDDYIELENADTSTLVIFIPGAPTSLCNRIPGAFRSGLCMFMPDQQYQNIAKAKLTGAELEAAYDWGWGFISAAGTYVDGKNEETGYGLTTVPPNRVSSTIGFRLLDNRLTLGGRVTGVAAKTRGDLPPGSAILPTKAYGLVDLFASYNYNDWLRADISIQNLFDKQYVQYLNYVASAGFQAKFGLTVKFASK
ncbi:TonB-dependent hemoglobin/transferrin/lactoferrin family receptor [Chelatococcus reniformis]|uniref:TonB-dependent receptor n=1 Tax=Chelatococcus reniformis TaxID=1494448 RepID=A0A916TXW3_9HYPH|nr:TonB-dependent hemoglobin/transferrin/lactoferrin family receptor [Chelatococcus reniformis]GGC51708.1 TonB-dependent receptor [Chelatococcus reniformis]